jgi:hypothetical protein
MFPEWLKKLVGQEEMARPLAQPKEEEKEGFLSKVLGSKTITGEGHNIQEIPGLVDPEAEARLSRKEAPTRTGIKGWMDEQKITKVNPNVQNYIDTELLPLTRAKGIPDALAAAQWAVEGGREVKNNPFGLLWKGEIFDYGSLDDAISDYDLTIRDIASRNMGIPKESFNYEDYDADTILMALQADKTGTPAKIRYEGHSQEPLEYIDLIKSVAEWRKYR